MQELLNTRTHNLYQYRLFVYNFAYFSYFFCKTLYSNYFDKFKLLHLYVYLYLCVWINLYNYKKTIVEKMRHGMSWCCVHLCTPNPRSHLCKIITKKCAIHFRRETANEKTVLSKENRIYIRGEFTESLGMNFFSPFQPEREFKVYKSCKCSQIICSRVH